MASLLKNRLFRIHNWMDRNEKAKFLLMILGVGIPNIMIQLSDSHQMVMCGVFLFMFVCLFTLSRITYLSGSLKFDYSSYKIPSIGEVVVITKDFWYYDGFFHKNKPKESLSVSPASCVRKDREWVISDIKKDKTDYTISMYDVLYPNDKVNIFYLDSRKFWKTKKDIRQNKLKKLGI